MNVTESSSSKAFNFDVPKKCGWINEFLWTCAGVNKNVLRYCPSDYAKYAGIGGTILFTALMAALSGGYALNFVFDNTYIAVAFGIFWGLLIFNLDRFIVNTMYSDGKHTISWAELKSGLPRIIMAIFLGIVISTPLELKIFEDNIKMQIEIEKQVILDQRLAGLNNRIEHLKDEKTSYVEGVYDTQDGTIHLGNVQIDALTDSISKLEIERNTVQRQLNIFNSQKAKLNTNSDNYEKEKLAIENKMAPFYFKRNQITSKLKKYRQQRDELIIKNGGIINEQNSDKTSAIKKIDLQIDSIQRLVDQARILHSDWTSDQIRKNGSELDKINLEYSGFNAQLKAFHSLRDWSEETGKEENRINDIAAWFIMLLFVIIETAPTFFKMMMEDGAYDNLLNAEKHRVEVLSKMKISDVNDFVNTEVKISTMKNQKRLEAELIANEEILQKLASVQAELLKKSIDAWREEELKKIEEDPSSYLQIKMKPNSKMK